MRPAEELDRLREDGLLRELRRQPAAGGKFERDGRMILNFSSNDYLNLANDPRLKAAAVRATEKYGCGGTASRLMSGNLDLHEALEAALANWMGTEAALVFGNGFLANVGVLSALAERGDAIFADKLNHASLIDGARLSGARMFRYRHADAEHLDELLNKNAKFRRRIIVTDSVFSMDGDVAPLKSIGELAKRHNAILVVDEAHAIGVLGRSGSGLCAGLAEELRPDVVIGTMGKALGSYGGYAACPAEMRQYLINKARTFIYSTALPAGVAAAALKAIEIVQSEFSLGPRLMDRVHFFYNKLNEHGILSHPVATRIKKIEIDSGGQAWKAVISKNALRIAQSPILPVMVGDNTRSVRIAERLINKGMLAVAVRPPTVPAGTARLRLSVTLAHNEDDLIRAADILSAALGVESSSQDHE